MVTCSVTPVPVPVAQEQAVTRDLYPDDAVGPGRSFERVKMPDVPSGEYNLEIFVAEVGRRAGHVGVRAAVSCSVCSVFNSPGSVCSVLDSPGSVCSVFDSPGSMCSVFRPPGFLCSVFNSLNSVCTVLRYTIRPLKFRGLFTRHINSS